VPTPYASDAKSSPSTPTSRGIHFSLYFINIDQQGKRLALLRCTEIGKESRRLAIHVRDVFLTKQDFVREQSSTLELIHLENINGFVRINKSRMLACIVLQCRYHYLSMFLTISQPPDLYNRTSHLGILTGLQDSLTSIYIRTWHPTCKRKWDGIEKCVIKLEGVEAQEVVSRITNLDSNCSISNSLIIMDITAISDGMPLKKQSSLISPLLYFKHGEAGALGAYPHKYYLSMIKLYFYPLQIIVHGLVGIGDGLHHGHVTSP
jgi:hypothetical protein